FLYICSQELCLMIVRTSNSKDGHIKFKEGIKNEMNWALIEGFRRYLKIYSMLEYINKNQECSASEIMQKVDLCRSTLYDYIDRAFKAKLIDKETNTDINKNGAHYLVVVKPELKLFLREFNKIILEFFNLMLKYHEDLG
ncbi:MAG: hypothetical protein ACFFDN_32100, partial [Candidatus Hodarchaeota archaeon]